MTFGLRIWGLFSVIDLHGPAVHFSINLPGKFIKSVAGCYRFLLSLDNFLSAISGNGCSASWAVFSGTGATTVIVTSDAFFFLAFPCFDLAEHDLVVGNKPCHGNKKNSQCRYSREPPSSAGRPFQTVEIPYYFLYDPACYLLFAIAETGDQGIITQDIYRSRDPLCFFDYG